MFKTKQSVEKHVAAVLNQLSTERERKKRGYQIAKLFYNIKEYDTARRYLLDYLCVCNDNSSAYKLLGQITEALVQQCKLSWSDSMDAYKKSFQLDSSQKDVLIKICELLCEYEREDADSFLFWLEKLEYHVPQCPVILSMKEHLVKENDGYSKNDVQHFIERELIKSPYDTTLRIKLLKLLAEKNMLEEFVNVIISAEMDKLHYDSIGWYNSIVQLCKETNIIHDDTRYIWIKLWALIALMRLSLCYKQIPDCAEILFRLDQTLFDITIQRDDALNLVVEEAQSQLYFFCGCFLLKKITEGQLSGLEGLEWACACFVLSLQVSEPPSVDYFFNNVVLTKLWQQISTGRLCQIGNFLKNVENRRGLSSIMKVFGDFTYDQVQNALYEMIFGWSQFKQYNVSSFLVNKQSLLTLNASLPTAGEQLSWNKKSLSQFGCDLHLLVWILLQPSAVSYDWELCMNLPYGTDHWSKVTVESLCELDFQAFLVALAYVARNSSVDAEYILKPSVLCKRLCSKEQEEWWYCAFRIQSGLSGNTMSDDRRIVLQGLNVIRAIRDLPVTLLVHLASFFANKVKHLSSGISNRRFVHSLAVHYWSLALDSIKTGSNDRGFDKLFRFVNKPLNSELEKWIIEGEMFLAQHDLEIGADDNALKRLRKLKIPEASFTEALVYKKQAENEQGKEINHEMYEKLLEKSRQALYVTMDRLQLTPDHVLHTSVAEELEDIEAKMEQSVMLANKKSQDRGNEIFFEKSSTILGNSDFCERNLSSTSIPFNSSVYNFTSPNAQKIKPSPERMDAQIRSLQSTQTFLLKAVLDDVQDNKKLIKELQERVSVLEKQLERQQWWNATSYNYQRVGDIVGISQYPTFYPFPAAAASMDNLPFNARQAATQLTMPLDMSAIPGGTPVALPPNLGLNLKHIQHESSNGLPAMQAASTPVKRLSNTSTKLQDGQTKDVKQVEHQNPILAQHLASLNDSFLNKCSTSNASPNSFDQVNFVSLPNRESLLSNKSIEEKLKTNFSNSEVVSLPNLCGPAVNVTSSTNDQLPVKFSGVQPPINYLTSTEQTSSKNFLPTINSVAITNSMNISASFATSQPSNVPFAQQIKVMSTTTSPMSLQSIRFSAPNSICNITSSIASVVSMSPKIPFSSQASATSFEISSPNEQDVRYSATCKTFNILSGTSPMISSAFIAASTNSNLFAFKPNQPVQVSSIVSNCNLPFATSLFSEPQIKNTSTNVAVNASHVSSNASVNATKPVSSQPLHIISETFKFSSSPTPACGSVKKVMSSNAFSNTTSVIFGAMTSKNNNANVSIDNLFNRSSSPAVTNVEIKISSVLTDSAKTPQSFDFKAFSTSHASSDALQNDANKNMIIARPPSFTTDEISVNSGATKSLQSSLTTPNNNGKLPLLPLETKTNQIFPANNFSVASSLPSFAELAKQADPQPKFSKHQTDFKGFPEAGQPLFGGSSRPAVQRKFSEGEAADEEVLDEYEPDVHFKPVVSLPELVEIKTGEENEEKLFGERAKLYRLDTNDKQWKERGVGEIKILLHLSSGKFRIVMRREQVLKVCANHTITSEMRLLAKSDTSWCWTACDYSEDEMKVEQFCVRFKTIEIAKKFYEIFEKGYKVDVSSKNSVSNSQTNNKLTTPLAELFKKKEGDWDCPTCMIRNKSSAMKCIACETAQSFNSKICNKEKDTVGISSTANDDKVYTNESSDNVNTMSSLSNFTIDSSKSSQPLSELFKRGDGEWDCSICLIRNKAEVLKCPACETVRPNTGRNLQTLISKAENSNTAAKSFMLGPEGFQFPCMQYQSQPSELKKTASPFSGFKFASSTQAGNSKTENFLTASGFVFPITQSSVLKSNETNVGLLGVQTCTVSTSGYVLNSVSSQLSATVSSCNYIFTSPSSQPSSVVLVSSSNQSVVTPISRSNFMFTAPRVKLDDIVISNEFKFTSTNVQSTGSSDWKPVTGFFSAVNQPVQSCDLSGNLKKNSTRNYAEAKLADGSITDDDVIYLHTNKASLKNIEEAHRWLLPDHFYLDHGKTCQGCIGCDPDKFDFSSIGPAQTSEINSSPQAAKINATSISNILEFNVLGNKNEKMVTDFASLAAQNSGDFTFGKNSASNMPFAWSGAGSKLFTQDGDKKTDEELENTNEDDDREIEAEPNIHFDALVTLPEVETKTGEEDETIIFNERAKLYRFDGNQWKERGVGNMKILQHKTTGKFRMLMRREQVLKLACNHSLTTDIHLQQMMSCETAWCWVAVDYADNEPTPQKFSIRFKNADLAKNFKEVFEKCQYKLKEISQNLVWDKDTEDKNKRQNVEFQQISQSFAIGPQNDSDFSKKMSKENTDQKKNSQFQSNMTGTDNDDVVESSVIYTDYEANESEDLNNSEGKLFEKRVTMFINEKNVGQGYLIVVMDEEMNDTMCINFVGDKTSTQLKCLINQSISMKSMDRKKKSCTWQTKGDKGGQIYTVLFSSLQATEEFMDLFQQGINLVTNENND